jgi:surface polysaccharide O-acyltransferase-like enzyme
MYTSVGMKKYIFQADVVRSLAIIGVVGVHLVIPITARPDFFGGKIWWLTFLLNCLFRMSVPLFVMLSGYLTLGKQKTIQDNNNHVFRRIFVPLVAYYLIFNAAYAAMAWLRSEPYDYAGIFHNLSKNTHTSLYFLVILTFIQFLNPLWNLMTEQKNIPVMKFVTNFFLILGSTAYMFYYLSLREGEVFSTFTLWIMWLGYYLYGYLVKIKPQLLTKRETINYLILLCGGYLATVVFGYSTLFLYHRGINDLFYIGGQTYADAYLSVSVIAMTIASFNLLMRSKWLEKLQNNKLIAKLVVFLAGISFAMYLNHLLVLDVFNKFFGITPDSPSMPSLGIYLIVSTAITFTLTTLAAIVLKATPGLRLIVGEK